MLAASAVQRGCGCGLLIVKSLGLLLVKQSKASTLPVLAASAVQRGCGLGLRLVKSLGLLLVKQSKASTPPVLAASTVLRGCGLCHAKALAAAATIPQPL